MTRPAEQDAEIGARADRPRWSSCAFSVAVTGAIIFVYMYVLNLILADNGIRVRPLAEAAFTILLYFAVAPFFAFIAMRAGILRQVKRLIMFVFMGFMPIVFIGTLLYALVPGVEPAVAYGEGPDAEATAWAETLSLRVLKAFPAVLAAPILFVAFVRVHESRLRARRR